jgi:hypothetical protein
MVDFPLKTVDLPIEKCYFPLDMVDYQRVKPPFETRYVPMSQLQLHPPTVPMSIPRRPDFYRTATKPRPNV